jgi:hypothetical protein
MPMNKPETIRLPRVGFQCPHSGMTRAALNGLVLPTADNDFKPPVDSYVLKRKGARTGIRLISYESLLAYIHAHKQLPGKPEVSK